jgi:antirestriction protein ArdC
MRERDGRRPARAEQQQPNQEAYLKGVVEQGAQQLLTELQQGKSEHLQHYLAFSSRFHRYSPLNQLLIFLQKPEATRVAGYRTWQKLGYQVGKGEKGIRILAPRPYTRVPEETGEEQQAVRFVSVAVFDASQLANLAEKPLPEFFTPLEDDQQELCTRLEQAIGTEGIALREAAATQGAQGLSRHGEIVLKEGLDSRSKFLTLTHEYAHELLHWDEEGKAQSAMVKECHAEAVSYVVAAHFGLHNPFSSDYLQQWGATPELLLKDLATVTKAASHIIDKLTPPKEDPHSAPGDE